MTLTLSQNQFDTEVLQSDVPVLVDFFTSWCRPCQRLAPIIDELADESGGRFRVVKVDAEQEPGLADRFRINSVPTLLVFRGGETIERLLGVHDKTAILSALGMDLP